MPLPPQIWAWTYDPNGNPRTQTDPVGTVSTHSYDALNRRTATTYVSAPAGSPSARAWVYDPNGNPTRISETRDGQTVALELIYDAFNRPTNLLDANNRAWVQTFDAADQRRTLTSDGVPAVSWSYDNASRNTQIIVEGAGTFGLGYDAADRNETISHPNGVQTTHVFDAAGRIEDIHHARNGGTIARFHYGYDANGNRISQIEENGGPAQTNTYAYDFADRLTDITEPNRYTRYVLNGNSNRIETREGATAAAAIKRYEADFNARNEITQQREYNSAGAVIATTNFEFDANGNIARQSKPGAETQYRYDALDRLIDVTPPTGPPAQYRYGPSDVRIASTTGSQETRFHYDGERLILESNAVGNPQKHYAYTAAGLLNSALLGAQPQHRSAHLDAQTSPVALSADSGNLVSRSRFDAFGVETSLFGERDQRVSHQGYWSEPALESGGAQLSAGRIYFPGLGIFPERDPAEGTINSPISFNPYLIGRSNPLRWLDPDGRCDLGCQFSHQWAYNGPHAAARQFEVNAPGLAITAGALTAVGDTALAIVQSPFQFTAAIGGTALEYTSLRSGHKYSDQLGSMIAGGVDTASGVFEHGPIDYASLKAGEVARSIQDAAAEGRYFDAGREGGNAVVGTALAVTGVTAGTRSIAGQFMPKAPTPSPGPRFNTLDDEAGAPLPGRYEEGAPSPTPSVQRLSGTDFGVSPITADPRLHRMWEDALKEAYYGSPSKAEKGVAYRRYLDALETSVGDAAPYARRAFETVRDMFKKRVKAAIAGGEIFQGFSFENIHHWNWYLKDHAEHAVDPRHLFPVTRSQHELIHERTTLGPDPTYDPINPVHVMELDGSYPLAPRE